jgi:hypothetical protein
MKMNVYIYYFLQLLPSDKLGGSQNYIHRHHGYVTQKMGLSDYDGSGLADLYNFSNNYSLGNRIKLRAQ